MSSFKSLNKVLLSVPMMVMLLANGMAFAQTTPNLPNPWILPDSPIYALKTTVEDLITAFNTNDTAKAQYELKLAEERLAEIKAMMNKGDTANAAKAQQRHDNEVNDVEKIADKQGNDNHGQAVKTYVHQLIADHEDHIGQLVSAFNQQSVGNQLNGTQGQNTTSGKFQELESETKQIRNSHQDNEQRNPNVHVKTDN